MSEFTIDMIIFFLAGLALIMASLAWARLSALEADIDRILECAPSWLRSPLTLGDERGGERCSSERSRS